MAKTRWLFNKPHKLPKTYEKLMTEQFIQELIDNGTIDNIIDKHMQDEINRIQSQYA